MMAKIVKIDTELDKSPAAGHPVVGTKVKIYDGESPPEGKVCIELMVTDGEVHCIGGNYPISDLEEYEDDPIRVYIRKDCIKEE